MVASNALPAEGKGEAMSHRSTGEAMVPRTRKRCRDPRGFAAQDADLIDVAEVRGATTSMLAAGAGTSLPLIPP